jgi:hypothetical protein
MDTTPPVEERAETCGRGRKILTEGLSYVIYIAIVIPFIVKLIL